MLTKMRNPMSKQKFYDLISDTIYITLTQAISRGSIILLSLTLSSVYSGPDFFQFQYFLATSSVMAVYMSLGLPVKATRSAAQHSLLREVSALSDVFYCGVATMIASVVVMLICIVPLADLVFGPITTPPILYFIYGTSLALNSVILGSLNGLQAYKATTLISIFSIVPLLIGVYVAFIDGDPSNMMLVLTVSAVLSASLSLAVLFRLTPIFKSATQDKFKVSRLLKVSFNALPNFLVSITYGTLIWLVGRSLIDVSSNGNEYSKFTIAMQFFSLLIFIPNSLAQSFFPRIVSDGNKGFTSKKLKDLLVVNALMVLVCFMFFFFFINILNMYFESKFIFANSDVAILFVMAVFASAMRVVGNSLIALDHSIMWLIANLLGGASIGLYSLLTDGNDAFYSLSQLTVGFFAIAAAGAVLLSNRNRA
jgi:O-antigen/teichoic acid export membrane protein